MIKTILFAFLAVCGVNSTNPNEQPDKKPPDESVKDQHFCCTSIDVKTSSGDGCIAIGKEHMGQCKKVLYCNGSWANDEGKVTCL
jgi:hypothetical protein